MPKISVIIPCYNGGEYLPEAIDSVLAQTFTDYEIIIADDGSDDFTTLAVIKAQERKDTRINALLQNDNKGAANARNRAIKEAKGEYILPLDADDVLVPTCLEKTLALIESEQADLVYVNYQCFGDSTHTAKMMTNSEALKKKLPFQNCFSIVSLFKKACWQEFGGFDESLLYREDWDFWLNFAEYDKKLVHLDEVMFYYRRYAGGVSKQDSHHLRRKIIKQVHKSHASLYRLGNYYLTLNFLRFVVRKNLIGFSLRKNRKYLKLFGIYIIRPPYY